MPEQPHCIDPGLGLYNRNIAPLSVKSQFSHLSSWSFRNSNLQLPNSLSCFIEISPVLDHSHQHKNMFQYIHISSLNRKGKRFLYRTSHLGSLSPCAMKQIPRTPLLFPISQFPLGLPRLAFHDPTAPRLLSSRLWGISTATNSGVLSLSLSYLTSAAFYRVEYFTFLWLPVCGQGHVTKTILDPPRLFQPLAKYPQVTEQPFILFLPHGHTLPPTLLVLSFKCNVRKYNRNCHLRWA